MTREEYIRTKAKLAGIDDALSEGHLTPEERAELHALSAALSEQLVTPWIPAGWVRRGMMLTLSAVGVYGLVAGLYILVWSFPLIAIFSPRIVGENFHPTARHDRKSLTDSSPSMGA
jgi:hypothetical protein